MCPLYPLPPTPPSLTLWHCRLLKPSRIDELSSPTPSPPHFHLVVVFPATTRLGLRFFLYFIQACRFNTILLVPSWVWRSVIQCVQISNKFVNKLRKSRKRG
jgi:hypothetical protein